MKPHKELFEKHRKGHLDDTAVEELHRILTDTYFEAPETLNQDELEYAEDLVFELYTKKKLDKNHEDQFRNKMGSDQSLSRKYQLLRRLNDAGESWKALRLQRFLRAGATDNEEEAQLREVLQEVIEKAHAVKDTVPQTEPTVGIMKRIMNFFNSLELPDILFRPQVKLAFAMASVALVAIVVWFTVYQKPGEQLAGNLATDSVLNKPVTGNENILPPGGTSTQSDTKVENIVPGPLVQQENKVPEGGTTIIDNKSARLAQGDRQVDPQQQAAFDNLLAANYVSPDFEYSLTRGETTAEMELFVKAADSYMLKEWDSCAAILDGLLTHRAFQHPDSISEIHFYLGQCYLQKALAGKNDRHFERAVKEFNAISPDNEYYAESLWYAALANLGLGKATEGVKILDELLLAGEDPSGKIKSLKEQVMGLLRN